MEIQRADLAIIKEKNYANRTNQLYIQRYPLSYFKRTARKESFGYPISNESGKKRT